MLKNFLLITLLSSAALLGCSTTETKPDVTPKPIPKAVVPPVTTKTTPAPVQKKPTSKPHLDGLQVPPQTNDTVLGKKWANCTADIMVLSDFSDEIMQRIQPFSDKKTLFSGQQSIKELRQVAAIFQQFSIAAVGEPVAKATFETRYKQQMSLYINDWQHLLNKVNANDDKQTEQAVDEWSTAYIAQVNQVVKNGKGCQDDLKTYEARFSPKVKAQLMASR